MTAQPLPGAFAPLTDADKIAPVVDGRKFEDELIQPIPDNSPAMPLSHPQLGKPTAQWTYTDEQGKPIFYVLRFDPPGRKKEFRPLSLWRDVYGLRWLWKMVPSPRPLYNLGAIASYPDRAVIVCEGEKTADCARQIFPQSIVTAWTGGSEAVDKTDWAPIKGRPRVLLVPDNDDAGRKAMAQVGVILADLGIKDIQIVDIEKLAALAPDGSGKAVEQGWDLADAVVEWNDLGALCQAMSIAVRPWHEFKGGFDTIDTIDTPSAGQQPWEAPDFFAA
jgi:hypothetical protein